MKVLVTGHTGLIGRAAMQRLERDGHDLYRDVGDLRSVGMAASFLWRIIPDVVVHCAAKLGGVASQQADPTMPITDSLVIGAQMIGAAAKASLDRPLHFVFLSSSVVYPAHVGLDDIATEQWLREPEPQYRGVGKMKIFLEDLLAHYVTKFPQFSYTILRPTAVYGPGDKSDHVIPDLIKRALAGERPLRVWGSPDTVRDFVYVDDVANAISAVVERPSVNDVFNVGSGVQTSIRTLAETIVECTAGKVHGLIFDESKPTAIPFRAVSVEHMQKAYAWTPQTTLARGIGRTVAYFK